MKCTAAVQCPQRLNHGDFGDLLALCPVPKEKADICGSEQNGSANTGFTAMKFTALFSANSELC